MAPKSKSILYFVHGNMPTPEDFAAAKAIGTNKFRSDNVSGTDFIEPCDGVAGSVPEVYKHFPLVKPPEPPPPPPPPPPVGPTATPTVTPKAPWEQ